MKTQNRTAALMITRAHNTRFPSHRVVAILTRDELWTVVVDDWSDKTRDALNGCKEIVR
jgi:hypothetical protein